MFPNEYFVVKVIERFAIVYKEHSYESILLVGSPVTRVDHLHQGVRRTGAGKSSELAFVNLRGYIVVDTVEYNSFNNSRQYGPNIAFQ